MDLEIAGRRAFVSGSNTGIGKGIAKALASEGAIVIVHGRDRARAERTARELADAGARTDVATGDLSTREGAASVIEQLAAIGPIDILVNNAGGVANPLSDWLSVPEEDWEGSFQLNVMSAVRTIRALVPGMIARGWGRIINIGSATGLQPGPDIAEYQANKAALLNLTLSLSKSLTDSGVTANMVSPGPILTPPARKWLQSLAAKRGEEDIGPVGREIARDHYNVSLARWGTTAEIGAAVAFLASPRSDFTTGTNLHVDGGSMQALH